MAWKDELYSINNDRFSGTRCKSIVWEWNKKNASNERMDEKEEKSKRAKKGEEWWEERRSCFGCLLFTKCNTKGKCVWIEILGWLVSPQDAWLYWTEFCSLLFHSDGCLILYFHLKDACSLCVLFSMSNEHWARESVPQGEKMKTRTLALYQSFYMTFLSLSLSMLVCGCVCFLVVYVYSRTQVLRRQREREQSLLFILSKEVKVSLTEAETLLSKSRAKKREEAKKRKRKKVKHH